MKARRFSMGGGTTAKLVRRTDDGSAAAVEMVPLRQQQQEDPSPSSTNASSSSLDKDQVCSATHERHQKRSFCQTFCFIIKWIFRCFCYVVLVFIMVTLVLLIIEVVFLKNHEKQGLLGQGAKSFSAMHDNESVHCTRLGSYELLQTVPHNTRAFTEGLTVLADRNGRLRMYEGTGLYGQSALRLLDINTGRVRQQYKLPREFFGEGIAFFRENDQLRLVQLTYKEHTAFEYVLEPLSLPLKPTANWTFRTTANEGWGITYSTESGIVDGRDVFFVSDGSTRLHIWDSKTKQQLRTVTVHYQRPDMPQKKEMRYLNELEWDPFTKTVIGNVWTENVVVRIDPSNGFVKTIYDLSSLFPIRERSFLTDVMNGIALTYDSTLSGNSSNSAFDQVWVTGKYWPHMYRIRLIG